MTLKEKINQDYLKYFKERNIIAKNLLSVVKGEIQTVEKNVCNENLSDQEITKILNKFAKNITENISSLVKIYQESGDPFAKLGYELSIIEGYLPKQMSKEEVTEKVTLLYNSGITNIGSIMKEFANLQVDKKMVSETIKEIIK